MSHNLTDFLPSDTIRTTETASPCAVRRDGELGESRMTRSQIVRRLRSSGANRWAGSLIVFALFVPFAHTQEPTASQIFENFRKVYVKMKAFAADFEEETTMDRQTRTAKGQLLFQKPNKLRQKYLDPKNPNGPPAQEIILDGKTSWSYTPWLNQVTRKEMNPQSSRELLPGAGENFEKLSANFTIARKADPVAAKKGVYLLEMTPKPTKETPAGSETLEVWIRASDWAPIQFAYTNKPNDMRTVMRFTSLNLDAEPNPKAFTFVPPAGVEVVTIKDDYKADK